MPCSVQNSGYFLALNCLPLSESSFCTVVLVPANSLIILRVAAMNASVFVTLITKFSNLWHYSRNFWIGGINHRIFEFWIINHWVFKIVWLLIIAFLNFWHNWSSHFWNFKTIGDSIFEYVVEWLFIEILSFCDITGDCIFWNCEIIFW